MSTGVGKVVAEIRNSILRISHRRSVASMQADPDVRFLAAGDDQVGQWVAGHGRRVCSGVGVALVDNGEQDCFGGYYGGGRSPWFSG